MYNKRKQLVNIMELIGEYLKRMTGMKKRKKKKSLTLAEILSSEEIKRLNTESFSTFYAREIRYGQEIICLRGDTDGDY